ncbi:PREDICTED: P-selectin glycoprotein ligand 1 [Elephantulus edwardii]|uniref:P-selectin glycoprotein ligand 1 n=1 Tax=Elephantulus edwardii TaxID=28737 RepID=UPI0003F095DF|nr:PREDICTED: P-selectin glycoprotein ligand 1 [Elephantulus edwardii]
MHILPALIFTPPAPEQGDTTAATPMLSPIEQLCGLEHIVSRSLGLRALICAMPLQIFLLLTLLGPGSWKARAWKATDLLLARERRQIQENPDYFPDEDYELYNTEPPEMLENSSEAPALMRTKEPRSPVGPGTPEPDSVGLGTNDSAGQGTGGTAAGDLSTDLVTQGSLETQDSFNTELVTIIPSTVEFSTIDVLTTEVATTEAPPTEPPTTEPPPTEPPSTEASPTEPPTTEAPPTEQPTPDAPPTEPLSSGAPPTKQPTAKVPPTKPRTTEATPSDQPTTEVPPTESSSFAPTTIVSVDLPATVAGTIDSATTSLPTVSLPMSSGPHSDIFGTVNRSIDAIKHWKYGQGVTPRSSVAPNPTGLPNSIPVKQCLLAILILALVATIFLVCTVVLAIRLSRKNHTYPVRSYSPSEMVCISSLLPEGGEGPNAAANGGPPNVTKGQGQGSKPEPGEERNGDDLTLHSFLP